MPRRYRDPYGRNFERRPTDGAVRVLHSPSPVIPDDLRKLWANLGIGRPQTEHMGVRSRPMAQATNQQPVHILALLTDLEAEIRGAARRVELDPSLKPEADRLFHMADEVRQVIRPVVAERCER